MTPQTAYGCVLRFAQFPWPRSVTCPRSRELRLLSRISKAHAERACARKRCSARGCQTRNKSSRYGGEWVLVGLPVFKTAGGPLWSAVGSIPTPLRHAAPCSPRARLALFGDPLADSPKLAPPRIHLGEMPLLADRLRRKRGQAMDTGAVDRRQRIPLQPEARGEGRAREHHTAQSVQN